MAEAAEAGARPSGIVPESVESPDEARLQPPEAGPQPVGAAEREDDAPALQGLLLDWGGVMTSNVFASFAAFCEEEGLDPQALAIAFRQDQVTRELLFGFEEGRIAEEQFETQLGSLLGARSSMGLIDRLFSGAQPEQAMVAAVRAAKLAGIRTGLVSNSWGTTRYPRDLLAELFDGVVISGEVGIRKPTARIYELGAEAIGLPPCECVFVDDLPFNLPPAEELGMAVVHHTAPDATIEALQRLLRISLAAAA